jgi:hypothetical protein
LGTKIQKAGLMPAQTADKVPPKPGHAPGFVV